MTDSAADGARRENVTASTFLEAVADLTEHKNKVESANSRYRGRRKFWKKEGINLAMLDAVLLLKRADEADVQADEKDRLRYAQWIGLNLGFQAEMDLTPLTPKEQEQRSKNDAKQMGYLAGKGGEPRSANFFKDQPGNIGYAAWDEGWIVGEKEHFAGAAPAARQPSKGRGPEASKKKAKATETPPAAVPEAEAPAGDQTGDPDQVPAPLKVEPDAGEQEKAPAPDFPETQGRA